MPNLREYGSQELLTERAEAAHAGGDAEEGGGDGEQREGDDEQRAVAKLREFADLGYPASVWKDACCHVASSGGSAICHVAEQRWFRDLDRRGADASAKTALFGQGMFLDGAFLP